MNEYLRFDDVPAADRATVCGLARALGSRVDDDFTEWATSMLAGGGCAGCVYHPYWRSWAPCKSSPRPGSDFCYWHDPDRPPPTRPRQPPDARARHAHFRRRQRDRMIVACAAVLEAFPRGRR